ncbi:hypothetical protein [Streptomyces paludis]|nr:hypothetical protein [Streptomyces paludis]
MTALDARHNILTILESWAGLVAEKAGGKAPTRSVPHLVGFLLRHLEWLAEQPPAAEFADEISALRRELLRTIDPEPGESPALTRDCVVAGCTGEITTGTGTGTANSIRCSSGHTWDVREWITLRPLIERRGKGADV